MRKIVQANGDLINTIYEAKVKLEHWEVYIETLIIKIIFTSNTVLNLSKETEFKTFKKPEKASIIDIPSMYILTRSIIENYLTLNYIYFNNLSKDEQQFRFKLWEVSGLISRQGYKAITSKKYLKQLEDEKIRIEVIMDELKKDPLFDTLKNNQIWKLTKFGLPRLKSWNNLILESNLKKKYFETSFSLFSNYAHSEYISMMQLNEVTLNSSNPTTISNAEMTLYLVKMINSIIAHSLRDKFKIIEIVYNTLPQSLQTKIDFWYNLAIEE